MIQLQLVKTSPIGTLPSASGGNVFLSNVESSLAPIEDTSGFGELHTNTIRTIEKLDKLLDFRSVYGINWLIYEGVIFYVGTLTCFIVLARLWRAASTRALRRLNGTYRVEEHDPNGVFGSYQHFLFLYLHGCFESC